MRNRHGCTLCGDGAYLAVSSSVFHTSIRRHSLADITFACPLKFFKEAGSHRWLRYGLTCSTSGMGVSGTAVAISRLNRSVEPSNIHPPSLQREPVTIDFPIRTRSAFAVASRSARVRNARRQTDERSVPRSFIGVFTSHRVSSNNASAIARSRSTEAASHFVGNHAPSFAYHAA